MENRLVDRPQVALSETHILTKYQGYLAVPQYLWFIIDLVIGVLALACAMRLGEAPVIWIWGLSLFLWIFFRIWFDFVQPLTWRYKLWTIL
jgi:hypothetical protein